MFLFSSFDPFSKKHGGSSSVNREKDKLLHKMKREKKSAKKELRKDTSFLAKQKFREIRERYVNPLNPFKTLAQIPQSFL